MVFLAIYPCQEEGSVPVDLDSTIATVTISDTSQVIIITTGNPQKSATTVTAPRTEVTVEVSFSIPSKIEYTEELGNPASAIYIEKSDEVKKFFRPSLESAANKSNSILDRIHVDFFRSENARKRRQTIDENVQISFVARTTVTAIYNKQVVTDAAEVDETIISTEIQENVKSETTEVINDTPVNNQLFSSQVELAYAQPTATKVGLQEPTSQPTTTSSAIIMKLTISLMYFVSLCF